MGLYEQLRDRIDRQRANPAPPVASWQNNQPVSTDEFSPDKYGDYLATSNDIYTVANIRSRAIAKLTIRTLDGKGEEQPNSELARLLKHPNPFWSGSKFLKMTELSLCAWGRAVWVVEAAAPGSRPRELWWVKPTRMRPVQSATDYISGYQYELPGGRTMPFGVSEVVDISYPNPIDEFSPLSPLAAARQAADTSAEAMRANRNLFAQGMMGGGFIGPPDDRTEWTEQQAKDLEKLLDQRFRGTDNAHKWQVLRFMLKMSPMNVTPKDMQFTEGLGMTFRQVCRVYGVPPPLAGDAEFATLANLTVYERQLWEQTMEDETDLIADEINRVLVPRFPGVVEAKFDLSKVVALQDDENLEWSRANQQIERGALTINEWRQEQGLDEVPWGDSWWASGLLVPVGEDPPDAPKEQPGVADQRRLAWRSRGLDTLTGQMEDDFRSLFTRQRDDVLRRLKEGETEDPFDQKVWEGRFAETLAPRLYAVMKAAADRATAEIRTATRGDDDLRRKATLRAGRLAGEMNTTTFKELRKAMRESLAAGESAEQLIARVDKIMEHARTKRARLAAESETTGAVTDGQLDAWGIPGLNVRKKWVTAGDEKVRGTHAAVDGVTLELDDLFQVGECLGIGPSRMDTDCPGESINCRCVLAPVLAEPKRAATLAAIREVLL